MAIPPSPPSPPSSAPSALLVDDARFSKHLPLGHHPERPERLTAARAAMARSRLNFTRIAAREATLEELVRVHLPSFVEALERRRGASLYLDPDTYVGPDSVAAARLAAGGTVALIDAMLDAAPGSPEARGVALVRPPGHHARPGKAMGFCLVNNVAVAAAHARARGLGRVAIVDYDVHHGNGTQEIFYRDPGVLYVSAHQFPFYPGTGDSSELGEGDGRGYTINVPLTAGGGDAVYGGVFERIILPVLEEYSPELVLVSAGFDAAIRDPLSEMRLGSEAFGWMTRELRRVAERSAGGRIALVLEGGYDLVGLEAGLTSALLALHEDPGSIERGVDEPDVVRALAAVKAAWPHLG